MISDILSQMVVDLDHYLTDSTFDHVYVGETRERIIRLRNEADDLRSVLDMPPVAIPAAEDRPHETDAASSGWIDRMMSDETVFDLTMPYFSRSDLAKRGWTKGLIEQLLGPPDWTTENPHGPGFAPMQCYRQDRVLLAEDTPAFAPSRRKIRDQKVPAIEID
jgi:hypothetical protein